MKKGSSKLLCSISRPGRLAALALACMLLGSACSDSTDKAPSSAAGAGAQALTSASSPSPAAKAGTASKGSSTSVASKGTTTTTADSHDRGSAKHPAPLKPLDFPYKTTLDVSASVAPRCIPRGGTATVTVRTEPEAAVAYHAVYAGNEGGSEAPFGRGHGGNDKGFTSDKGTYKSTWVIGPSAPYGPARVDVIIGFEAEWGYDDPPFAVANESGKCPASWFKKGKKS